MSHKNSAPVDGFIGNSAKRRIFAGIFLLTSVLVALSPCAAYAEVQMDWLIEGQIDVQTGGQESGIVSSYKETEPSRLVYDRFATDNQYSMGDSEITIHSKEGQILNGVIIEQQKLQKESFKHKIRYYDRFSDGYVEIAEALLDPIGDNRYLIKGVSLDYNPNSNLELYVLERGYSMDNLEAIPNDIFTPKKFTLGREMMHNAIQSGEGEFDLREYSPNHLILNKEQIQEKMSNVLGEQNSQILNDLMSGDDLRHTDTLQDADTGISQNPVDSKDVFDGFKFEPSRFEDTGHVSQLMEEKPFQTASAESSQAYLLIVPLVALLVSAYLIRRKSSKRHTAPHTSKPAANFRKLTQDMLERSRVLYESGQRKEAYGLLSQAIRYYYCQSMGMRREVTNLDLLTVLDRSQTGEYARVRDWLLLCASVEYARYDSKHDDFDDMLSQFSKEIS